MEAAAAFTTPEDASVKDYATGGKHWALKKNVPTVTIPIKMANQLRIMYNEQNPHCAPEEAAIRLLALPEYHQSLYVKHVMTADKIKVFFSSLKKKKKDGAVPELTRTAGSNGYRSFSTVDAMKVEYHRRLDQGEITKPKPMPSKKDEWALLLELNDLQRANTLTETDEETQHLDEAEEAGREEAGDVEEYFENAVEEEQTSLEEALGQHDLLGDDTPGSE